MDMNDHVWIDNMMEAEYHRGLADGRADERKRIRERASDGMVMEEIAYAMFSAPEKDDNDTDPCGDYFRRMADKAVEVFLNPVIVQLTTGEPAIGLTVEDEQP